MSKLLLTGAGTPGAFSILGLAPAIWLKPESLAALNDGDAVTTWTDSSGNGRDFTQSDATKKPLYKTNIVNGKSALLFDNTNDYLRAGSSTQVQHVFVVAKYNAGNFNDFDGLFTGVSNTTGDLILVGNTSNSTAFYPSGVTGTYYKDGTNFAQNNMSGPMNAFAVMSFESTGITNPLTAQIGEDRNNFGRGWGGYIAEVICFATPLSTTNRQSVEADLKAKYATP